MDGSATTALLAVRLPRRPARPPAPLRKVPATPVAPAEAPVSKGPRVGRWPGPATITGRRRGMGVVSVRTHVSTWPGLSPAQFVKPRATVPAPYPLGEEGTLYFHRARNAIYHLVRALALAPGESVLVPDYHSGNEVAAILAAG